MPGTLLYAAPATVLPGNLCTAFAQTTAWPLTQNNYPDGNFQTRADGVNGRHQWGVNQRLTYPTWVALKNFWLATRGPLTAFYFYPDPRLRDATGASATGRYTVRFDGEFPSTYGMPRWDVSLSLIEVA